MNRLCRLAMAALLLLLCAVVKGQQKFGNDTLQSVTVTARKPLITRKADRYLVHVAESFLATGHSGLEVLQQSPGIWVDANGNIRLQGNKSVMIMINEVMLRLSGEELAGYLRTLKSEDISRIEVIRSPPAEYEAAGAGGIIHIILKKPVRDGLNGSVNAQYRLQGTKSYATVGSTMDYKRKDCYLQGSYSIIKDPRSIVEKALIVYPDKSRYSNVTDRLDDAERALYRFGIAYDISKSHSLGIQTTGTLTRFRQAFQTAIASKTASDYITGDATSGRRRHINFNSTTASYTWKPDTLGSVLKVIADYTSNKRTEQSWFEELYTAPAQNAKYRNETPAATDIYSIQADYTKKLAGKTEIKSGIKFASFKRDNELVQEDAVNNEWVLNAGKSNRFIYKEGLLMLYLSLDKTIRKTSMKLGLRAEQTYSDGNAMPSGQTFSRKYAGLFPSLFVMQTLNAQKGNALFMSYARRLGRPTLGDLNPNRIQFNNYTAVTGNPALAPQYTHNLELGYNFLSNYSVSGYAALTSDVITLLADTGKNNFIEYSTVNFSTSAEYGLSLEAPFRIIKGWNTNNSFSFYSLSYDNHTIRSRQVSVSAKSVHTVYLEKLFAIDAVANYRSATTYSNLASPHQFSLDLGFSKKLLADQFTIRLGFPDLLNTVREKEITDYNGTHIDFYRKRPTQTAGIAVTYNFTAGKKFSNKKIEQGSADERNRIGN